MALITTSGSMPFSLASASIVCCSGFDILYPLELHLENRAHLAADVRAVLDAHALLGRRRRPGPVDLHPEHHARRFAPELDVEDLEAAIGGNAAGDLTHLLDDRFGGHKRKKWAHAHSVLHPGSETKIIASDAAKVHRRKQRIQTPRDRARQAPGRATRS